MDKTSHTDFLKAIRLAELAQIEEILQNTVPAGAAVLEIGAGTGWQARALADRGYVVTAIDIPTSNHSQARIWPIIDFDGRYIPFADESFDIVYSSNVLEHVEHIQTLNKEIVRVLRSGGTVIHYVPTSTWRVWSLLAFYPALAREIFRRLRRKIAGSQLGLSPQHITPAAAFSTNLQSLLVKVDRCIVPHAHGAVGTWFSELWRFSRQSWNRFFIASGWEIAAYARNGIFLTGDMILGAQLSISRRKRLSHIFGCTAHLYVLNRRSDK